LTTTTVSVEKFRTETQRRLIDTFELMLELGLRSRDAVWRRVENGTLPEPVIRRANTIALWDRDALALSDRKEQA
jgi:predicted DNA-binding transcriptional regulator AlpA